jgi:hypothetical protein
MTPAYYTDDEDSSWIKLFHLGIVVTSIVGDAVISVAA